MIVVQTGVGCSTNGFFQLLEQYLSLLLVEFEVVMPAQDDGICLGVRATSILGFVYLEYVGSKIEASFGKKHMRGCADVKTEMTFLPRR